MMLRRRLSWKIGDTEEEVPRKIDDAEEEVDFPFTKKNQWPKADYPIFPVSSLL